MKLLLDVNVVLDVLLAREPWYREAARLLSAIESGRARGYLAAHSITTIHYIVSANRDRQAAVAAVSDLLGLLTVVPADADDFRQALALDLRDFEDAVQAVCALKVEADAIVTRNEADFRGQPIPADPPGVVLARLQDL